MSKKKKDCNCGAVENKTQILNNFAYIGVNTEFQDDWIFKDNYGLCTENNFCPQCGLKYEEDKDD